MTNINVFSLELARNLVDSPDQFPVDFDIAWEWLDFSRKDIAKKSFLKCGFVENLDFSQFRQKVELEQGGNTYKDIIKLSVECLKTWAMMVGTSKGKEVRMYFLECEKIAKSVAFKPMSPAELIIAQGQAMLALEQKQAALELEQKRMSEAMIQQAVQIEVSRVLAEKTAAQVEVHDKAIDSLTADIQALKAILAAPVPTCNQTLRQKIVETTQILGSALVKKGVYKTHPEAMREVWGRLMLKIKSSSARKNIPLLKTNLEKQYVKDMEEYNQKKALGIKVSKPLKKDYFKNNAEWIQDLNLEQIAYNCIMSVIQDFMSTLAMVA